MNELFTLIFKNNVLTTFLINAVIGSGELELAAMVQNGFFSKDSKVGNVFSLGFGGNKALDSVFCGK